MTNPFASTFDPALDLELKREVAVPPDLVWRAWTEPSLLTQWFTPARGRPAIARSIWCPVASFAR